MGGRQKMGRLSSAKGLEVGLGVSSLRHTSQAVGRGRGGGGLGLGVLTEPFSKMAISFCERVCVHTHRLRQHARAHVCLCL